MVRGTASIGGLVEEVDTPALLLNLHVTTNNLEVMHTEASARGLLVRPHTKAHKSTRLARMQMEYQSTVGVCCAKLGELEVMVAGGISPVLLTSTLVTADKLQRFAGLALDADLMVIADSVQAVELLRKAAAEVGSQVGCLVDVDVGQNRTGVRSSEDAVRLAQVITDGSTNIQFAGVQGYEGHLQHIYDRGERQNAHRQAMEVLGEVVDALIAVGLAPPIVSTAGTGTAGFVQEYPFVTEIQPGSYATMDCDYASVEGVAYGPALLVQTTVVSDCAEDAVIVDAGFKAVAVDAGQPVPYHDGLGYQTYGDEHGRLWSEGAPLPSLGEQVLLVPSHCDTTVNLYDEYYVHDGRRVVGVWPIEARGRID